jgi:endoglucanase
VTATNAGYNPTIAAGGTVTFGFISSTGTGADNRPTTFTLNGSPCTVS